MKVPDINDQKMKTLLTKLAPDVIISAYFDQIIKDYIFDIPRLKTINFHPGILPEFPGPSSAFWALKLKGDLGGTVHYVDSNIDTGDIIAQRRLEKNGIRTVLRADREIFGIGSSLTLEALDLIGKGDVKVVSQQGYKGPYLSFPTKEDIRVAGKDKVRFFNPTDYITYFR
jgi:methionyl-tRNA formyltransferase